MLTVVGTEKMAVFDDTDADRKVTIYDKGYSPARFETWGEFQNLHGSGDVRIPRVPAAEPLQIECRPSSTRSAAAVVTVASGEEGLAVVEVLDGAAALDGRGRRADRRSTPTPASRAG